MVERERALKVRMDWRELVLSSMELIVMTALSIVSSTSEVARVWSLCGWLQMAHLSVFSRTSVPILMKPLHRKPRRSHFLHAPAFALISSCSCSAGLALTCPPLETLLFALFLLEDLVEKRTPKGRGGRERKEEEERRREQPIEEAGQQPPRQKARPENLQKKKVRDQKQNKKVFGPSRNKTNKTSNKKQER